MTVASLPPALADRFAAVTGVVLDIDGCLALFDAAGTGRGVALPGAADLVAAVRASGRPVIGFTNASSTTPTRIAQALQGLGIELDGAQILTPAVTAAAVIRARYADTPVLAFGGPGLLDVLREGGVNLAEGDTKVAAVVVGWDVDFAPDHRLQRAAEALWDGAALLVTSDARSFAARDRPAAGVSGFIARGLAHVGGCEYEVLGKPSPIAMQIAAERLGVPPAELLVVGDDLSLEIRMAREAGALAVLVTTGTHGADDVRTLAGAAKPDLVVGGLDELLELWRTADPDAGLRRRAT